MFRKILWSGWFAFIMLGGLYFYNLADQRTTAVTFANSELVEIVSMSTGPEGVDLREPIELCHGEACAQISK